LAYFALGGITALDRNGTRIVLIPF